MTETTETAGLTRSTGSFGSLEGSREALILATHLRLATPLRLGVAAVRAAAATIQLGAEHGADHGPGVRIGTGTGVGSEHGSQQDGGADAPDGTDLEGRTITQSRPETKTPAFYKVLLLNDDFTPMDFVIHVLQKFFQKDHTEAMQIMLQVHNQGSGVAGVFSHEIAETKAFQVNEYARRNQYPLKSTIQPA